MSKTPDFFVIGAQKAGTTNIYHLLRQHPDIFMPLMKEPGYFHWNGGDEKVRWANGSRTKVGVHSWQEYLGLYRGTGPAKAIGDASTIYMDSPHAARRIREATPDAKIVVMLRNPVDRAYSAYNYMRRDGKETATDFEAAISLEPTRIASGFSPAYFYIARGLYGRNLKIWFDLFPRSQIKIFFFEEFIKEPLGICAELYRFLGVDPEFEPDVKRSSDIGKNASGIPTNRVYAKIRSWAWGTTPVSSFFKKLIPFRFRERMRVFAWRLLGSRGLVKPEKMSGAHRDMLREMYRNDVSELELLLGRDLSTWK